MLPRAHRLTRATEFSHAVRTGARSGGRLLVVHVAEPGSVVAASHTDPVTRVGVVVSKAVGDAVVRNRVKRRIRHCVRTRLDLVTAGSLVVVRALPDSAAATSTELDAALARCLQRAGEGKVRA